MKKTLSEDDIRIIDNRGKYSISKWVVWSVVALTLAVATFSAVKITRQAKFIAQLTSGKEIVEAPSDMPVMSSKINIVELNGAKVNINLGKGNIKMIYKFLDLIPASVSSNPQKDLKDSYIAFKKHIGTEHLTEFTYTPIHVKVEYRNGEAYRYSFTNSINNYSMTVVCPYNDLVKALDGIVK